MSLISSLHKTLKYWLTAIFIMIVSKIVLIPLPRLLGFGRWIGRIAFKYARHRRHIVLCNLEACFPHLSETERLQLAKHNFESAGMAIFEILHAWLAKNTAIKSLFVYEGIEHLEAAKASKKGVILLTAHSCSLELGARGLTFLTPFHAMYRPHKNPYFDQWQYQKRYQQSQREPIAREQLRKILRLLKAGEMLWYAPDQNYGNTDHIFTPFFGVPALTITATSKIAKTTDAVVLPYYVFRTWTDDHQPRYLIKFFDVLSDFPSDDISQDCLRLNQLFESWITRAPEQYLWAHRRFKTRPIGSPSIY